MGICYLMIWKNERVSYHNIFPSCSVKYYYFSNIIRSEGLAVAVQAQFMFALVNGSVPTHKPHLLWLCRHKTVRWKTPSPLGLDLLPLLLSL